MEPNTISALDRAAAAIKAADAIVFTSGAGLGVDSGLPDFRGPEGFWRAYPPMKHLNLKFEEMSNPSWFTRDPALAWGFWGHRCDLYRRTVPHAGFEIMKALGEEKERSGKGYFIVTSNVDGQFIKAGFSERKLLEVHGSSQWMQCTSTSCEAGIWAAGDLKVKFDTNTYRAEEPMPKCIKCDRLARPNVLMFGDYSWLDDRNTGQEIEWDKWRETLKAETKVAIIEIGAGTHVPTIRILGHQLSKTSRWSGTLIRINPGEPEVPEGNISLPMGGLAALRGIQERIQRK